MIGQVTATWAARLSAIFFAVFALFQLTMAAGVNLGAVAWGGNSAVPSAGLRTASGIAAVVLLLAAGVMLIRSGDVGRRLPQRPFWWANLVLGLLLVLNTAANAISPSATERLIMTPAAAAGALLTLVALVRRAAG